MNRLAATVCPFCMSHTMGHCHFGQSSLLRVWFVSGSDFIGRMYLCLVRGSVPFGWNRYSHSKFERGKQSWSSSQQDHHHRFHLCLHGHLNRWLQQITAQMMLVFLFLSCQVGVALTIDCCLFDPTLCNSNYVDAFHAASTRRSWYWRLFAYDAHAWLLTTLVK